MKYRKVEIIRIKNNKREEISDIVVRESKLAIFLNGKKLVTLKGSPENYDYLGIGFLYTSGILQKKEDISSMVVDEEQKMFKVKAKNIYSPLESSLRDSLIPRRSNIEEKLISKLLPAKCFFKVKGGVIFRLMRTMEEKAELFKLTGGVHSCALADKQGSIILFTEDISRYNTIDKILGEAFLKDIPREDTMILTSCRITSDILIKIAFGKVPIIISRAAPTDKAVELAKKTGITLVGFVRDKRMNIYTYPERIEV
jgi:FdhD protein